MTHDFRRIGELKDIASYPVWLQRVVAETRRDKMRVVDHELFSLCATPGCRRRRCSAS